MSEGASEPGRVVGKGSLQQEGTGAAVRSQRCPSATALHSSRGRDGSMWEHGVSSFGAEHRAGSSAPVLLTEVTACDILGICQPGE